MIGRDPAEYDDEVRTPEWNRWYDPATDTWAPGCTDEYRPQAGRVEVRYRLAADAVVDWWAREGAGGGSGVPGPLAALLDRLAALRRQAAG